MLEIHRDVLFLERRKKIGDTFVILATSKSVDQEMVASPEKCVRAEVIVKN